MYHLKQVPEDFLVTELSSVQFKETGKYLYYKLVKKSWNTLDAVKRIAELLRIPEKQIGFAGSKDRNAITEQLISIAGVAREKVESIKLSGVELYLAGRGDMPISLGDLHGNAFEIVVRNMEQVPVQKINHIPNYFDEQRFGTHNVAIGKHLLKKDFATAVKSINDAHYVQSIQRYLQQHQNDYVGALKLLPVRLLRMYINAYQSYLWNETLALYLKEQGRKLLEIPYSLGKFVFVADLEEFLEVQVPLVGFGSQNVGAGKVSAEVPEGVQEIIAYLLNREKVTYDDFVIKQIPELTLEGELRPAFVEVRELKINTVENDELNIGTKKVLVSFTLGKGSYATIVIKRLFA